MNQMKLKGYVSAQHCKATREAVKVMFYCCLSVNHCVVRVWNIVFLMGFKSKRTKSMAKCPVSGALFL